MTRYRTRFLARVLVGPACAGWVCAASPAAGQIGADRTIGGVTAAEAPATGPREGTLQPRGWSDGLALPVPVDRNPDPRILEIDLVARLAEVEIAPGTRVEAWTYNGTLPGPLIRARVGDRVIVHFRNELPQPTTVHWHGIRVPIEMDGVPGISQPEVKTGESFTYDFIVPDAGAYWYHPHVMSAAQVGFGLYGPLVVDDPGEDEDVGVADELVLALSDIGIDRHGHLEPADSGGPAGMVFGREGNHVLVNGRVRPHLVARAGVPQRWRVINMAKSRYFMLSFEGLPLEVIGGDGGLQEHAVTSDTIVLGAGERVDVRVTPRGGPGGELVLRSLLYNRGYGSVEYRSVEELFTMQLADTEAYQAPPLPEVRRAIAPLDLDGAREVDIDLTLEKINAAESAFGLNGVPFWKAKPFLARLGETQIWNLRNTTEWAHPMHLHGFFFQVIDRDGRPVRPIVWKDTVNVPMKETVRMVVRFDPDRPGQWMYHCHILDHADGGLMGTVLVGDGAPTEHSHIQKPSPPRD
jgi:FtsP/CotA-like multicopper oxidase with cupredoxin domain